MQRPQLLPQLPLVCPLSSGAVALELELDELQELELVEVVADAELSRRVALVKLRW